MKKNLVYLILTLLVSWVAQACNNNQQKTDSVAQTEKANEFLDSAAEDDSEFMAEAASGGMMEVELGNLAQKNALSKRVKDFAAMMVADHTKANNELMQLAKNKTIALPATPGKDHQEYIDKLSKEKGTDFDRKYIDMMVKDHKEDVDEFEETAKDATDAEIKAFAAKTVPVLKMHLDSAKAINKFLTGKVGPNEITEGIGTMPHH